MTSLLRNTDRLSRMSYVRADDWGVDKIARLKMAPGPSMKFENIWLMIKLAKSLFRFDRAITSKRKEF